MKFTLTIEADSYGEIASLFSDRPAYAPRHEPEVTSDREEPDSVKEVEPEAETPKSRSRSRKGDAAKQDTPATKPSPESSSGSTAPSGASPSDEKVTFEDLRAKASELMDNGKVDGRGLQDMLKATFGDAVTAFGALTEDQYPKALEALEDLA